MKNWMLMTAGATLACGAANVAPIELMDTTDVTTGWREPGINRSCEGRPLRVGGRTWEKGLGVHAPSKGVFDLEGNAARFEATVGVDDESFGTVTFRVLGDGKLLWDSGRISARDKTRTKDVSVDLAGVQILTLEVTDFDGNRDGDHADWLDARITFRDGAYGSADPRQTRQLGILTPAPAAAPRINGTTVLGVRPGRPVLWRLPVTGEAPIACVVAGLPKGLSFDPVTRILSGAVAARGDHALEFTATNARGTATRTLTLKVGDRIGLTPAMGWNSWNCFMGDVTAEKVKRAADALVASGLADHGWSYVNIDDFWQNKAGAKDATLTGPARTADGTIVPNTRFPDMKGLADYVHAKGLKIGLYSSPGPTTCGGCTGSFGHEEQDARTYAAWGYDYLKYDWCSYGDVAKGDGLARAMKPYLVMGRALAAQERDIVFSLCQYGMDRVSTWGRCVDGHSWRTTGDVFDSWPKIAAAINQQRRLWYFSAPGAFNDPDMLCVGRMRWNAMMGSRLSPNEQYTHVSLWALVAAPLMIGCDLERLDAFTRNLLVNDEVIAIDQDPLGKGAARVAECGRGEVWMRPLADGSLAAGLYNRGLKEIEIAVDFAALGLEGAWAVRDCWRQADEGVATGRYVRSVPGHATHLVRLVPQAGARLRAGLCDVRDNDWLAVFAAGRK